MKKFLRFILFIFYILLIAIIIFFCVRHFNYYKVVFVVEDNAFTKLVKKGEVLKELDEPEKEGYSFLYWMDDGTIIYDEYEVKYDAVLTAVFEKKVEIESYYVSFDSDGGSRVEGQMVNEGEKVIEPSIPVKDGYVFNEWQLNGIAYDFNTPIDNDITLKATYIKDDGKSFVVKFNTFGGTQIEDKYVTRNSVVIKPSNPVRQGYVFKEWRLNGVTYDFNSKVRSDMTLDAVYSVDNRKIFTVKFDTKGGTTVNEQKVRSGEKVTIPAVPMKNGYKFSNWVYNNKVYNFDTEVNSDMVLDAVYVKNTNKVQSKIKRTYDSNTLKYWIEDYGTYAITHIWVKDAYNQFKVGIKEPFPQLATSNSIMNYISKTKNYKDKEIIGSNASGIVSDYFNVDTARAMPEWKYSSKSSVVMIDGVIKRNFTNLQIPKINAITYGLKKDGYLGYYRINNYNNVTRNVENYNKLVSDGVKYTFAFGPVLIHNGQISSSLAHDNNIRQALGQIDLHNFVLVTTTTTNRSKGLSYAALASIMKELNCIEAYNLDGGGSASLIYKPKGYETAKSILYTSRAVSDIIYFVE